MLYRQGYILDSEKPEGRLASSFSLAIKAIMALLISHTLCLILLELFSLSKMAFISLNLIILGCIFYKFSQFKNIKAVTFFTMFLVVVFGLKYYIDYAPELI